MQTLLDLGMTPAFVAYRAWCLQAMRVQGYGVVWC